MSQSRALLPRRQPVVPVLFATLFGADFLAVQQADAYALWQALCRSRWSEGQALKGVFHLHQHGHSVGYGLELLRGQLAPPRLIRVIEQLVKEGRLERQTASRVEEKILAHTDATGAWSSGKRPDSVEAVSEECPMEI
jgi:hypothetical protein